MNLVINVRIYFFFWRNKQKTIISARWRACSSTNISVTLCF